jgi:hypothetical protein
MKAVLLFGLSSKEATLEVVQQNGLLPIQSCAASQVASMLIQWASIRFWIG